MKRNQKLEGMLREVQRIKSENYVGTKEAYGVLKQISDAEGNPIKAVAVFYQAENRSYAKNRPYQELIAEWKHYDIAKDVFMNLYSGISEVPLNVRQKEMVEIIKSSKEPLEVKEIHIQF